MMPCKFLRIQLTAAVFTALSLAGCNDKQGLESGDKDDEEKSPAQRDAENLDGKVEDFQTNSAMSGSQDPALDDEENRIASQPANVSGAFLTTKVLKVEEGFGYLAAAAYNNGVLVYDRGGISTDFAMPVGAIVEDIRWIVCSGDDDEDCSELVGNPLGLQRSPITYAGDLIYSAIFRVPVNSLKDLSLRAEFSGNIVRESLQVRAFSRGDGQCSGTSCPVECNGGFVFYHFNGHTSGKYKIADGSKGIGTYEGITKICNESHWLLLGSAKLHMNRTNSGCNGVLCALEPLGGWQWQDNEGQISSGHADISTLNAECEGEGISRMWEDYLKLHHQMRANSLEAPVTKVEEDLSDNYTCP